MNRNMMSSPDPSSKKDNLRNSKKDSQPKEKKAADKPLSLLKDLPSLSGKLQPAAAQKQ